MKTTILESVVVGPLEENCYLLGCPETHKAVVVDPGTDAGRILRRIEELGLHPEAILNTHGHIDHVAANAEVAEHYGIPVWIHEDDAYMLSQKDSYGLAEVLRARTSPAPGRRLKDGDILEVGTLRIQVIHTPGHTPGSCCFLVGQDCLSGDTVFEGCVGRTDLEGGSGEALIRSIRGKILPLDDAVRLYPGHGPSTTVGDERSTNPYF